MKFTTSLGEIQQAWRSVAKSSMSWVIWNNIPLFLCHFRTCG